MSLPDEQMQCMLCDRKCVGSLISHITRTHSMPMHEYRSKFPNAIVQRQSAASNAKNAAAQRKRLEDPVTRQKFDEWRSFPSEVKHWTRKGYSEREAVERVVEFQRKQSLKGCNPITSAKRSAKNGGSKNPMSLVSIASREGVTEREAKQLTPCFGRTGDKHPMFGKKHTPEAIMKIASAPHLSNPDYRSEPERQLEICCAQLASIQHNVGIGKWNVDVLFEDVKLIVELFGDYWHMNPNKYAATIVHNLIGKTAAELWERDARKLAELHALGYHVEIIWESDWRSDSAACMERIALAHDKLLRG